jgi:hypothetical protein
MDIRDIRGELLNLGLDLSALRLKILHVNSKDQTNIELQNLIVRIDPLLEALDEITHKRDTRNS